MFGFVLGTMCVVGLGMMARRRRYHRGYGGCGGSYGGWHRHHHHGWHGHHGDWHGHHGGWHGGPYDAPPMYGRGRDRWWRGGVHLMLRRIQATPDQEKVIREALEDLMVSMQEHREEFRASRHDIAGALRGESFDAEAMGELFGRHDDRLTEVRKAVMEALGRIHAVLDDTQRERLAELLGRG